MNSAFAFIFLSVQKRIKDQVPEIRFIDQEMTQLEGYVERPPVTWPCVLIDLVNCQYENMGFNTQRGEADIVLRLGFPPFSHSSNLTPAAWRAKALEYYEIEWKLNKALHGWSPDGDQEDGDLVGPLTRISATTERREDPIRVRVLTFRVGFEDYSTENKYPKVDVSDYNSDYDPGDFGPIIPGLEIVQE